MFFGQILSHSHINVLRAPERYQAREILHLTPNSFFACVNPKLRKFTNGSMNNPNLGVFKGLSPYE